MTIFRENALKAIANRGLTQPALQWNEPQARVALTTLLLMFAVLMLWGCFANIPMTVEGSGVVVAAADWRESLNDLGRVMTAKNEQLSRATTLLDQKKALYQKNIITEADLVTAENDYLNAKTNATLPIETQMNNLNHFLRKSGQATSENNVVLILVRNNDAALLKTNLKTTLYQLNQPLYSSWEMHGQLQQVSNYPVSKEFASSYLGNKSLVDYLFEQGIPYFAVVAIGSQAKPGMLISASIQTHTCHPIQLMIHQDC